eukprot:scaffold2179_cov165-Amphora_coffeaeformis.AAC.28
MSRPVVTPPQHRSRRGMASHSDTQQETLLSSSLSKTTQTVQSLAGPYIVRCSRTPQSTITNEQTYTWSLYPLPSKPVVGADDNDVALVDPSQAWHALMQPSSMMMKIPEVTFHIHVNPQTESVTVVKRTGEMIRDADLDYILQAVAVQWATSVQPNKVRKWQVSLPDDHDDQILSFVKDQKPVELFATALGRLKYPEWVEMTDQSGKPLGMVPRPLVHTHNLLHRGIGMFVTKDRSIFLNNSEDGEILPDLYLHQRTATKRIFPSLYDMFVGGVSSAGESSRVTAQREVAEELGLRQADHLSATPLLTCVVCTGYNRCVVDLYEYVMDTTTESISWQAEEVAWGSFCSYDIIEAAADRSIQRLEAKHAWPGSSPAIQSPRKGELVGHRSTSDRNDAWKEWDFVPDGLLVWEAWLHWKAKKGEK